MRDKQNGRRKINTNCYYFAPADTEANRGDIVKATECPPSASIC